MSSAESSKPADSKSAESKPANASGGEALAATYAKALHGAATTAGKLPEVLEELGSFVVDVWYKLPTLAGILASRLVSSDDKQAMVTKALGGKASSTFSNFMQVLAEHDRLEFLPAIHEAVSSLQDETRGVMRVNVTTADPLDAEQINRLQVALRDLLGGEPIVENLIDPKIIGGLVLRVGDKVYDGSLASQLSRVREQMINRSIYEIQSKRDRFSSAERN